VESWKERTLLHQRLVFLPSSDTENNGNLHGSVVLATARCLSTKGTPVTILRIGNSHSESTGTVSARQAAGECRTPSRMMLVSLLMAASLSFRANARFKAITPGPVILAAAAEQDAQHFLKVGGAEIEVDIHLENSSLGAGDVLAWVRRAAQAATVYYGQFPVRHARVTVTQNRDNDRSIHGTTWGDVDGFQGVSRMRVGSAVSRADLDADWTMTHELTHLALSSLPDKNHWLEEGLATYVEPIARAQDGQLSAAQVWQGMVGGIPQGQPGIGDHGLDETHTWGRTYWGGAMFCLVADVKIRQATGNRKSLQDALRAIVAAGATIDTAWPLSRILRVGDQATGASVLENLYDSWKSTPVRVELDKLWSELGVRDSPQGIKFDPAAPSAQLRSSITDRPAN